MRSKRALSYKGDEMTGNQKKKYENKRRGRARGERIKGIKRRRQERKEHKERRGEKKKCRGLGKPERRETGTNVIQRHTFSRSVFRLNTGHRILIHT